MVYTQNRPQTILNQKKIVAYVSVIKKRMLQFGKVIKMTLPSTNKHSQLNNEIRNINWEHLESTPRDLLILDSYIRMLRIK